MAMVGAGAAGIAVAKILMNAGVKSIVACDRKGAIHTAADYRTAHELRRRRWLAEQHEPASGRAGSLVDVLEGADLFIGLSGPGVIEAKDLARMNPDPFVFAMANPNPEVQARGGRAVRARDGHRPLRLPEPDQQRARLPRHLPRRARRARRRRSPRR